MSFVRQVIYWFTFSQWFGMWVFWGIIFRLTTERSDLIAHIAVFLMVVCVGGTSMRVILGEQDKE